MKLSTGKHYGSLKSITHCTGPHPVIHTQTAAEITTKGGDLQRDFSQMMTSFYIRPYMTITRDYL